MISIQLIFLSSVTLLLFGRTNAAVGDLGEACIAATDSCTDTTNHVCDPSDYKCKVIADGAKTDCTSADTKCPANSVCSTTTCSCSAGYTQSSGLCTVIGDTCTADSDCSSKITNSYCAIIKPCSKGTCSCKSGYSGTVCTTLTYDMTCSASADLCGTGLTCGGSGKCSCSADSWVSAVGACTALKTFGQTCTVVTDCYRDAAANGACTNSKCTCAADYVEDASSGIESCRAAYAGETCTSTCTKLAHTYIAGGETSQQTPTCTSNTCQCGSTELTKEGGIGGTCYKYCLTSATPTKADGATCTAHNECNGYACLQCPGDASHVCYTAPCSGVSGIHVSTALLSILVAASAIKVIL